MATTTNRGYSTPATGASVGTWGSGDLNPNFAAIDTNLGGVAAVALASTTPTTLTPTQYANGTIRLSGVLTTDILVLFPNVQAWWTIENLCTGNFSVIARCVTPGGNQIGMPQGEAWDVMADGTNMKYRNLPHPIGAYWDDCGSAVPAWVTSCSIPPYLLCDGSAFSAVTYPYLNTKLGGTTLPDFRGRIRANLNGGTARITTASSGIDGDTRESAGGNQAVPIAQANLTNFTLSNTLGVTGSVNLTAGGSPLKVVSNASPSSTFGTASPVANTYTTAVYSNPDTASLTGSITGSVTSGGSATPLGIMPPTCIGGITMIRAGG